eukprot:553298_1
MSAPKQEEKDHISDGWVVDLNIESFEDSEYAKKVTSHLSKNGYWKSCFGGNKKRKKQENNDDDDDDDDDDDGFYVIDKITDLINYFTDLLPTTKSLRDWRVLDQIFSWVESRMKNNKNDDESVENKSQTDIGEENKENEIMDNKNNKIYLENKRIIRLSINNKLLSCLKVIFNQTISKLNCLNENDFYKLINQFENDINNQYKSMNNDMNKFVEQFIKNEYLLTIKNDEYIGSVMIKFKKDDNNNNKIYVACHALTQNYSSNDNIENIQNQINNTIKNAINMS